MEYIFYRHLRHYKYQLLEDYTVNIGLTLPEDTNIADYIILTSEGELRIKARYAWDGPSGPTIDTKNFMRGSLVHDALYQLIREKKLDIKYRTFADDLLKKMCREDGMHPFRAWYVHKAVLWFGKIAIKEKEKYKLKLYAPKPPQ